MKRRGGGGVYELSRIQPAVCFPLGRIHCADFNRHVYPLSLLFSDSVRSVEWFCSGGEEGIESLQAAGASSQMCLRIQHFLQQQSALQHQVHPQKSVNPIHHMHPMYSARLLCTCMIFRLRTDLFTELKRKRTDRQP